MMSDNWHGVSDNVTRAPDRGVQSFGTSMTSFRLKSILAGTLLASVFASPLVFADPVLTNGSFESPAQDSAGIYSGDIDGWIKSINAPSVIVNGNIQDGNGDWYGVTPYGSQYLGMDPRSPTGFADIVSQVIPGFEEDKWYKFTFYAADSDGGTGPVLNVLLSDGGDTYYAVRHYNLPVGGPYGTAIKFKKYTFYFHSPVTGDVALSFMNNGSTDSDDGSISLDNVQVKQVKKPSDDVLHAEQSSAFVKQSQ